MFAVEIYNKDKNVKLLASLLVALSLLVTGCSTSYHQELPEFHQLRELTWRVDMGEDASCSAVKVDAKLFLTAAHCQFPEMTIGGLKAVAVKVDRSKDLMLLYVHDINRTFPNAVLGKYPRLDSKVVTVGYPMGLGQFATEGRVQQVDMSKVPSHYMGVTSPVVFGNSGGPVFTLQDGQYRLVGIVSAMAVVPIGGFIPNIVTHMAFVVNANEIEEFLAK